MTQTILDKAGDNIAEAVHNASRATKAVSNALEDSAETVKNAIKQGGKAADEFMEDASRRLRRHPLQAVAISLTFGVMVGFVAGWIAKQRV